MGLAPRISTIMIIILLILNSFTHFARKPLAKAWNSSNLEGFRPKGRAMRNSIGTYREAGVRVDLILGCYPKASVAIPCCPGEINSSLQLLVHLLINGATKLCPVVSANKHSRDAKPPRKAGWSGTGLPKSDRGQGCCKWTGRITKQAPNYRKPDQMGLTPESEMFRGRREGYSTITGNTQGSSVNYSGCAELEVRFQNIL